MAKVNISSPWVIFYRELEALFGGDPEIKVVYDEDNTTVRLYVDNAAKAEAIEKLLPDKKVYGNVTLHIVVIPANQLDDSMASLFQTAFQNNPAFAYAKTVEGIFSNPISYVVFKNKVVQYFNDDLGDVNGNCSTLYQEIAKDVFDDHEGVFFCTDSEQNLGKPLGEWP